MGRVTLVALAVLALAASAGVADAKTYRWVDANGVVHYSDTPPQIPAVTGDRDALIEEALELSGIKQQLAGLAPQVAANTDLSKSPLDAQERAAVLQTLAAAFGLEPILATVRSVLRTGYDPQLMGVFVARLRTPTLRRLTAMEVEADTPELPKKLQAFAAGLRGSPPPAERVARLARLAAATSTAEYMLEVRGAVVRAGFRAIEPMLPPERRPKPGALDAAIAGMIAQQRDTMRNEVLVLFLYVYRAATDAELEEYITFEESEAGRWFQGLYRRGMLEAVSAASEQVVRQIAKSLPAKRFIAPPLPGGTKTR
ncbi:MAG: hypothetical protein A3E31_16815 [Candidatus Rokubacteria bacterium RIFCSPHIGHO2_12_FULL_73_22]|nr:MAG: hypothetical protein A3D33_17175 [Candidatus Rokubacteria bacterium RIFCSPHIGHO2_02_FULL_73_26]OGK98328.1 MAG: hypothetical protein A3E31_16815 [Candidatus Rokubacteria bacterium RIFCSPHIGHO2_12_FULL_73_22]OGL10019.1 MAG: hypothetical protein A3I14_16955 [Candidatus Rokubacteria bacterium RIFCSPLOWO2_02_FULL_73_56]OGL22947.1 MAG: hypothetical protein A3G44_17745 [Candidatus Rokubacteria bacterium RIFCSPLOWO2_12_FULL_73_47]